MSNPDTTKLFFTDFGATLDLSAMETGNSSVDNHAVICVFFVLTNWRPVKFYNTSSNILDETVLNNYDKWIIFGDTLSKGKKKDHVFHNACLTYLIDFYDKERQNNDKQPIPNNIVYTDNCTTQYKCRQNFYKLATYGSMNTRVIHKFAQNFCFKEPWDVTDKLVKGRILRKELKMDRCANAFDCYIKLKRDFTKDGTGKINQQWINWETNRDGKILQKDY